MWITSGFVLSVINVLFHIIYLINIFTRHFLSNTFTQSGGPINDTQILNAGTPITEVVHVTSS